MTASQHGFMSGKSVDTACFHLLDYVYSSLDKGKYVITLMFDLSKAFDTVDKEFLKQKLYNMGLRGNILNWIMSYMDGRILRVRVNNKYSSLRNLNLGVPQGSVLGPFLFLLYVNDMPNYIKSGHVTMFADDTTITVSADSPEEVEQLVYNVVDELSMWCQRNKLILNDRKTVCLNFGLQRLLPSTVTYDHLTLSEFGKLLGTNLDKKLLFDVHIDFVCKKLSKAYFAILQLKDVLDETDLLRTYYALAYPHISYNIICWGNARDKERVFIAQKRIIRLIYNLLPRETCHNIFKIKNILTTPCIYILKSLCFTKKNFKLFQMRAETHVYNTRYGELLSIPRHSTTRYEHSPFYSCILLYNRLPNEIRNIVNYNSFKNKVKELLISNSFYSIKDYLHGNF